MIEEFEQYNLALNIEIAEVRRRGKEQSITIINGEKIDEKTGGEYLYQFYFADEERFLKDDVPVKVTIGDKDIYGTLVSLNNKKIIISVSEDFGKKINIALLTIDDSILLVKLQDLLEKIQNEEEGTSFFHHETLEKVFFKKTSNVSQASQLDIDTKGLNDEQTNSIKTSLESECTYVWGPPGTGKTSTLAKTVEALFKQKKRILVTSNTNIAIDLLLYKLSETLKKESNKEFLDGKVLRYGTIIDEKLKKDYHTYVDPDLVAERLGKKLTEKKEAKQDERDRLLKKAAPLQKIIDAFNRAETIKKEIESLNKRKKQDPVKNLKEKIKLKEQQIYEKYQELREYKKKGAIGKFISLSDPEIIEQDIGLYKTHIEHYKKDIQKEKNKKEERNKKINDSLNKKQEEFEKINVLIKNKDFKKTKKKLDEITKPISKLEEEISELQKKLDKIKEEVIKNSQVLCMTATHAYLHIDEFGYDFDVVVIDEASMLLQPVVAFLAGMSKNKVILTGDFRQLPPIAQSRDKLVDLHIKRNIFEKAGIPIKIHDKDCPKNIIKLNKQYRMTEKICSLINENFYPDNPLKTIEIEKNFDETKCPEYLKGDSMFILDTQTLIPFANFRPKGFSRYNIMHAICARNLCFDLYRHGLIKTFDDVGVITPYAAQNKFLTTLCEEIGYKEINTGTVHRFQGNEKNIIIFDTTDSYGVPLGKFLRPYSLEDEGAKLLNVAFSRPKVKIILIANLAYLQKEIPKNYKEIPKWDREKLTEKKIKPKIILREIISYFVKKSKKIDVKKIIKLFPSDINDIPTVKSKKGFDFDKSKSSWFDEKDFDEQFVSDIKAAKKNIIIFSGFITAKRIAYLSDFFREKIKQGIKIHAFTRPSKDQGNIKESNAQEAIENLRKLGVKVDLRGRQHDKTILIDDDICWTGSLNPLSSDLKSEESMLRVVSKNLSTQKAMNEIYKRGGIKKGENPFDILYESHNPECLECGSKTMLLFRRRDRKPFVVCEDCDKAQDLDKPIKDAEQFSSPTFEKDDKKTNGSSNETLGACPKCKEEGRKGKMVKRWTPRHKRYFLSCDQFPKCRFTDNISNISKYSEKKTTATKKITMKPKDKLCLLNQMSYEQIPQDSKCLSTGLQFKDCCGKKN